MSTFGQKERATQNRVVKLFTDTPAQLARNGATALALGEKFLRKVRCG